MEGDDDERGKRHKMRDYDEIFCSSHKDTARHLFINKHLHLIGEFTQEQLRTGSCPVHPNHKLYVVCAHCGVEHGSSSHYGHCTPFNHFLMVTS